MTEIKTEAPGIVVLVVVNPAIKAATASVSSCFHVYCCCTGLCFRGRPLPRLGLSPAGDAVVDVEVDFLAGLGLVGLVAEVDFETVVLVG